MNASANYGDLLEPGLRKDKKKKKNERYERALEKAQRQENDSISKSVGVKKKSYANDLRKSMGK